MNIAHCILAHCTLLTAHCTLHTANCKLHTAHCTLHTAHCTLHPAYCILHTAHCTLHTAHCTLHTAHLTLHTAHMAGGWGCLSGERGLGEGRGHCVGEGRGGRLIVHGTAAVFPGGSDLMNTSRIFDLLGPKGPKTVFIGPI